MPTIDQTEKEVRTILGITSIRILDRNWIKRASNDLSFKNTQDDNFLKQVVDHTRFKSIADDFIFDSTIGGAYGFGGKPQYSRYTDPRSPGVIANREKVRYGDSSTDVGVGHYWAEAFGQHQQTLLIEAGVPEFASLLSFFYHATDYRDSIVVRTGREPYETAAFIGELTGSALALRLFPVTATIVWGLKMITEIALGDPNIEYYSLKPTMHHYWKMVSDVANTLALEMGILVTEEPIDNSGPEGIKLTLDRNSIEYARKYLPDIISPDGYVDVFSIFTKGQRLVEKRMMALKEGKNVTLGSLVRKDDDNIASRLESGITALAEFTKKVNEMGGETYGYIQKKKESLEKEAAASTDTTESTAGTGGGVMDMISSTTDTIKSMIDTGKELYETGTKIYEQGKSLYETATKKTTDVVNKIRENGLSDLELKMHKQRSDSQINYFRAIRNDGARHVALVVDYLTDHTIEFSNSTQEIPTQSMMNGFSATARDIRFSMADGNLIGNVGKQVTAAMSDLLSGNIDGVSLGLSNVVEGLIGGGVIHMPEMWASSSVSLPNYHFKMTLPAIYGNKMYLFKNIYMLIALLLPLGAPRAIGKSSHGSPFILSAHLPGFVDIKKGIMSRVNIKKGIGSMPYNKDNLALGIEAEFVITDLDNLIAMPLKSGVKNISMDNNSILMRYLKMVAGSNIYESNHWLPRARMRMAGLSSDFSVGTSAAYLRSLTSFNMPFIGQIGMTRDLKKELHETFGQ